MKKTINKKESKEISSKKYKCKTCEGCGLIQSEDGGESVPCPQCEGSGVYNPNI